MAGVLAVVLVAGVVNLVAEQGEVFHHRLADHAAVLADTAGEHERVDARECHGDAADFTGQLVAEGFESDLSANVAFACCLRQGAHVVREARETEKAGFLVYKLVEAVDIVAVLLADEEEDCRVEATGTGTHDKAIERLLLDEPTNHLDIPAIQWLEGIVTRLNCAVMFVSHDRAFVRRVASRIFELDRGRLRGWDFPYDKFVQFRDQALAEEDKANALFDKRLAEEEVWIRKGIQARRTRNEGRVRALIKMREERAARRTRTGSVNMQITEAERSGRLVARLTDVNYSYDGAPLISHLTTEVSRGDRIGIVGPNGSGKTTLLRLILGELQPDSGDVRLGTNLQIAYFDQMRTKLREDKSLVENIGDGQAYITLNGVKRHVLSYLQDFLFSADRARGPISALSGGERNRLLLACLFSHPSNVLVLDEPTNDLDMETLDLLAELLADYKGTVLTVSHDRAFLDSVVTSVLAIEEGGNVFESVGGYSDYEAKKKVRDKEAANAARIAAEKEAEKAAAKASQNSATNPASAAPAKKKKRSYNEEREYAALPDKIEKLEAEIAEFQAELSKPEVFTNATRIVELQKEIADREQELEKAYERYEILDSYAS